MGELESATQAYERALNFNGNSVRALIAISCILRSKDQFPAAVEYLRQILRIEQNNGDVWSSLGKSIGSWLTQTLLTSHRPLLPYDG